ncbi:MAG TPA: DUF5666 domain-containing protein [Gammaproteobacteria bacterium]|nr:DUF5666 domain-containing protein [Gammaproteobacteria bacterium]
MRAVHVVVGRSRLGTIATALLVASCGIDQGGGPRAPEVPTTETVLVSGPIDAFGSVHVNGLALDTSRTQIRIDGHAATQADLKLGQMIRAVAVVDDASASAVSIDYEDNVVGPVAAVDAAAGELTVLGQRVRVAATTRFDGLAGIDDLKIDDRVAVSGIPLPGNAVLATYVARAAAGEASEVAGTITSADTAALRFELGALTVDYSRAVLIEVPGGSPAPNIVVEVRGTLDNGLLVAERVRSLPLLPGAFMAAGTALTNTELAGAVTASIPQPSAVNFAGVITARVAGVLYFGDLKVRLTPATIVSGTPDDLVAGARVVVAGRIQALGRVDATRIVIQ